MLDNSQRIWVIIERLPDKQYVVQEWTVGYYEYNSYAQYLIENFNVEVYYKPWHLQKKINELEESNKEVILWKKVGS